MGRAPEMWDRLNRTRRRKFLALPLLFFYLINRSQNQENCMQGSENGKHFFPEQRAKRQRPLSVRAELAKPGSCNISGWLRRSNSAHASASAILMGCRPGAER